jgi:hypothetical protein
VRVDDQFQDADSTVGTLSTEEQDQAALAAACWDMHRDEMVLREHIETAYRLLLKGTQFPEKALFLTTLDMLRWPAQRRVVPVYSPEMTPARAIALLGNVQQRVMRNHAKELRQAAKAMRSRDADRFVAEYLYTTRKRVRRRFTDDLSERVYHQRWDFIKCFGLLARCEYQLAVLRVCVAGYRRGLPVAAIAAKAQDRLEAARRGQVVPMSRGTDLRSHGRLA